MCNLLKKLLSFDTLGELKKFFFCFEVSFWVVNPIPTSFGQWYLKHNSKTWFHDLHFIVLDKKNDIWCGTIFRENNIELAKFFLLNCDFSRTRYN